jgi:YD repeat-containing protein
VSGFAAPGNRTYVYGYDTIGRFTTITYPDNTVRIYHYENATFPHALTGITDENGVRFATWAYDSTGRATSSQHAGGAERVNLYYGSYSTTANEGSTSVVDAFGTTRVYYYQGAAGTVRVKRVTQPCPGCNGTNTIYTFDANGNVASVTDFNGIKTTYVFDLARNLESRTEGAEPRRPHDEHAVAPVHRLFTKITSPGGRYDEIRLRYDARCPEDRHGGASKTVDDRLQRTRTVLTVDGSRRCCRRHAHTHHDAPTRRMPGNLRINAPARHHVQQLRCRYQPTRITDANGAATTTPTTVGTLRTHAYRQRRQSRCGNDDVRLRWCRQLTSVAMLDGTILRYQYDDAHRLSETQTTRAGDPVHARRFGQSDPGGCFDSADRLVRSQQRSTRSFDSTAILPRDIGAGYDGNGNLTTSRPPRTTALATMAELLLTTDPQEATRYARRDDRPTSARPDQSTTSYTYDGLGNLHDRETDTISTFVPDFAHIVDHRRSRPCDELHL